MQGRKGIQPKMMYQVSLDTLVAKDNYYRRVASELDLSFLYKETARYYGSEGQESIDPVVFFKLCLVGYLNNICSDRRLMEFCSNRLDIRLYIKYDIDEALPWHSTVSRTRQLYGEEVFLSLFREVLSMCVEKGMVRGKRQAVDSIFVKANASMGSLVKREIAADVATYADELEKGSEHKAVLKKEEGEPPVDKDSGKTSNATHYSPTDPDAKVSTKPGKPCALNYYGQVAVDDAHHVVTGACADTADKRDSQCTERIVGLTLENLATENMEVEQVLADTGYSSGAALRYLEANNIDAYIPNTGSLKLEREGFTYNAALDRYECTQGNREVLAYKRTDIGESGAAKKIYMSGGRCKTCPLRERCIGKYAYKKITDSADKALYLAMHEKMQTPFGKKTVRMRGKTVEPVLGSLVNFLAMKKVNTKGLAQANKHVLMATLCYNLKKYLRFVAKKVKAVAAEMPTGTLEDTLYTAIWASMPAMCNKAQK